MDVGNKAVLATILLVVALFEFWTAMQVLGKKSAHSKLMLRLHRIGGYVFLLMLFALYWIGLGMLGRFSNIGSWDFDTRKFTHAGLATLLIVVLLVKLAVVRVYRNFRQMAKPLGFVLTIGTVVLWAIAAWFYWAILGGVKPAG